MRIKNFLLATLVTMIIVGLNAQTTGLTDDFSNEANSLIILSSGMGMDIEYPVSESDPTLAMTMNKSIKNEELVIDYHWISDAAYNEIRITPPNGTTFELSSSGQFLTFNYRVGTLFPITFGFKDISGNFTESQTIILEGDGLTHTASFAINTTVPNADYSNIDYIQLILNRGPNKLNSELANCTLHIDNLVIGDGSFEVSPITTGLTDNFSNETNSLAIYTEGIGTFTTRELEITKTTANGELTIDYDWITNNGFNTIRITPPNELIFDLSATGQGLSFEYSSTDAYKITIGYQGQTPSSYIGYLEVTNPGETKTFTVPASAIPSYSAIPYLQIIVNTGAGQAIDNPDADGTIVIDNLVIGDGTFQVKDGSTLGIPNIFYNTTGNNQWGTAGNWGSGSVPTSTTDVRILSGQSIQAGSSTTAVANTIIVDGEGSLTIDETSSLTVSDDFTNNGTVTLKSGGSLIVSGTSSGNVTYNRTIDFVDGNLKGWYLLSSPVVGQDYNDDYVTANDIASNGTNRGIATYTTASDSWAYHQGAGSATFTAGKGYSLKRQTNTGTVSFTGTLNTNDAGVDVTLDNTGNRYNLLGNPYTSSISSATLLGNGVLSETQTIWIYDQTSGTNGAYAVSTLADNFILAPGQGFFVKANQAGGTVNFSEANQSHGADTFQKTVNTEIKFKISVDGFQNYAKIYYLDKATKGFDVGYEGEIFGGVTDSFSIYSQLLSDNIGKKYQVQSLPNSDFENMVISIVVKAAAGKEITLTADALNLPEGIKVFLEDREENTFTRLDEVNSEYKITPKEALNGIGRFYLHTKQSSLSVSDADLLESVSIYSLNNSIVRIAGLYEGKANMKLYDILGKESMNISFEANGVKDISLPRLSSGVYIVQLETAKGKLNKKIILE